MGPPRPGEHGQGKMRLQCRFAGLGVNRRLSAVPGRVAGSSTGSLPSWGRRANFHCHVNAMPSLFSGEEFVTTLLDLGTTHVVWVPDSDFGPWEFTLEASRLQLVRVCREGEAWPLAAGLYLGGASPVILMQTTGLFESGDALRNVLFDLGLPLLAVVGARNWFVADSRPPVSEDAPLSKDVPLSKDARLSKDTARRFTQPILQAWGVNCTIVESLEHKSRLADHFRACQSSGQAGIVVLAEGPG